MSLAKWIHLLYPNYENPSEHAVNTLVIFHPQKKYITDILHEKYFNELCKVVHNVKLPFTNVVLICDDGCSDGEIVWEPLDESVNSLRMEFPNVTVYRCFGQFNGKNLESFIVSHAEKGEKHTVFLAGTFQDSTSQNLFADVTGFLVNLPDTTMVLVEPLDTEQTEDISMDELSELVTKLFTDPSVDVNAVLTSNGKSLANMYFEDFEIPIDDLGKGISYGYLETLQKYVLDLFSSQSVMQISEQVFQPTHFFKYREMSKPAMQSPVFVGRSGLGGWTKYGPNDKVILIEFGVDANKQVLVKAESNGHRMFLSVDSFDELPKLHFGNPVRNELGHVVGLDNQGRFVSGLIYQGFMPNPFNTDDAWERATVIAVRQPMETGRWTQGLEAKIDSFLITILTSWLKSNAKNLI